MCKDSGRKTNTKDETWSRGTYAQRRNQKTATHSYSRPNILDPPTNTFSLLRQYSKPTEQTAYKPTWEKAQNSRF